MRSVSRFLLPLVALLCAGCASMVEVSKARGQLSLASTHDLAAVYEPLSTQRVAAQSCFKAQAYVSMDDPIFERAVQDALETVPDATVLLDVRLRDTGPCFEISGIPGKAR